MLNPSGFKIVSNGFEMFLQLPFSLNTIAREDVVPGHVIVNFVFHG
jgi:hypothetical protein